MPPPSQLLSFVSVFPLYHMGELRGGEYSMPNRILVPEMTQMHVVLLKKWIQTGMMTMQSTGGSEVVRKGLVTFVHC